MTLETGGAGGGEVDDVAVRDALDQIDSLVSGDEAKRRRIAENPSAAAPPPPPPAQTAYTQPVPPPAQAAYRAPVPVTSAFGDRPIADVLGLSAPSIPSASSDPYGAPLPQPPRDMVSLEDIYVRFPDIGQGPTVLRVERIDPKMYGNQPTAGFLGDLAEQISTNDFAARYGGGKYKIAIVGPKRDRFSKLPIEGAPSQTLATLDIRIPGMPNTVPEGYDMNQQRPGYYPPPQPYPYGMAPQMTAVELKRMELDREREKEAVQNAMHRIDPIVYQTMNEQAKDAIQAVERSAHERVVAVQAQLALASDRIRELEHYQTKLIEEKIGLERDVANARQMTETQQIRELKDRYELQLRELKDARDRELRDIKDRHDDAMKQRIEDSNREKDRYTTDHRLALETETRRHAEERAKLVDDLRSERDQTRERTKEQIELATREHDRNVTGLKSTYEDRIRQLQESHRDRIESLERTLRDQLQSEKSNHEREIRSMGETRAVIERTVQQSADMRINQLAERLERAEADNEELARENRDLHAKLNKPPGEYLAEVGDVAKNLLGMKTAEEAKASGDEEFSLTKVAATSLKNLIEKGPEIARTIADIRQGGPQAQAIAQQQAAQAQAQHQHQLALAQHNEQQRQAWIADQERRRAHQQQQQARRPGENARPPQWAAQQQVPPPQARNVAASAAANVVPRRRQAPPPTTGFPNVAPMASPVSERVTGNPAHAGVAPIAQPVDQHESVSMPPELRPPPPPPMAAEASQPQPPPQQQPAPAQAPEGQAAAPMGPPPDLPVEAINEFINDLASAIKAKVSAKFFATELVNKIGRDAAAGIVGRVTAEGVISDLEAFAEQNPAFASSPILTLEGKRYLREVFKQTTHLISGQAA